MAPENVAGFRELAAMAMAQVWSEKSKLPTHTEMESHTRKYCEWRATLCATQPIQRIEGLIESHSWLRFVHGTAGNGLCEQLGWTWPGVWFSVCNSSLYLTLEFGVNMPHMWRLFKTGKKGVWDGALDAVLRLNRRSREALTNHGGEDFKRIAYRGNSWHICKHARFASRPGLQATQKCNRAVPARRRPIVP